MKMGVFVWLEKSRHSRASGKFLVQLEMSFGNFPERERKLSQK
jgi:hypothetical protein